MKMSLSGKVIHLVRKHGVIRANDFVQAGVPTAILSRMVKRGDLVRIGRGLYSAPDTEITEHHNLVQIAKRVPRGVVCLISALNFHALTTQIPHEVWLAIDVKAHKPKIDYPPIRIVRFSGIALEYGIETHVLEGVAVSITSVAKTVADCFKYRNKIGLDVALEALRDALKTRAATSDEIWNAAKACRVASVMEPYLQAML